MIPSGLLNKNNHSTLTCTNKTTTKLYNLYHSYGNVDFIPLQDNNGFDINWVNRTEFDHNKKAMLTAAALHYKGDIPSVVRFCGGPHVGTHRNVPSILKDLEPILKPELHQDLKQVFTQGYPACCKAESTEDNWQVHTQYTLGCIFPQNSPGIPGIPFLLTFFTFPCSWNA